VSALRAHQDIEPWIEIDRTMLRFRRTDLDLMTRGSRPLSVSTDRLGVTALRCGLLQSLWSTEIWSGVAPPRDGSGPLVEVYPAAALRAWGLPAAGYKKDSAVRALILGAISDQLDGWLDVSAVESRCLASDHALDALLCALVAFASATAATEAPPAAERVHALREGWIHVPTCDLDALRGRTLDP
jgi:hypothetical protein